MTALPPKAEVDLRSSYVAEGDITPVVGSLESEPIAGVCRLAATTVQAEMLEARMVDGEQIDVGQLCTLASTTVRIASRLGLERRAKPVTPTVKD